MARRKEFDEAQVLEAALKVFWQRGYGNTSMQDLEKAMELTRTSIYNAFGNKSSLFKKALALYIEKVQSLLRTISSEAPTCREAMKKWLEAVIDLQFSEENPRGCLVILSVLEGSQHDAETRKMGEQLLHAQQRLIAETLQEGVKRGEFSKRFDCEGVATALTAVVSGLVVLATAKFPVTKLYELAQVSLRLLEE